jgi:hypothetical protein
MTTPAHGPPPTPHGARTTRPRDYLLAGIILLVGLIIAGREVSILHGKTFTMGTITLIARHHKGDPNARIVFNDHRGQEHQFTRSLPIGYHGGDHIRVSYGDQPDMDADIGEFDECFGMAYILVMMALLMAAVTWLMPWCRRCFDASYPVNDPALVPAGNAENPADRAANPG